MNHQSNFVEIFFSGKIYLFLGLLIKNLDINLLGHVCMCSWLTLDGRMHWFTRTNKNFIWPSGGLHKPILPRKWMLCPSLNSPWSRLIFARLEFSKILFEFWLVILFPKLFLRLFWVVLISCKAGWGCLKSYSFIRSQKYDDFCITS